MIDVCAGADAVIHLAASPGVGISITAPGPSLEVNFWGTFNALEAARAQKVRRFIFASTNAVVGAHTPPMDETKVPAPVSPYGAGKAAGEALCHSYSQAYGLGTVSLRFSNLYGPYCFHKSSVVASFFNAALQGQPLTIYGDGSQTRDLLHVDDLNRAILAALDRAPSGSVFQVASGVETPIGALAERINAVIELDGGTPAPIRFEGVRAGDVARNYSSIDLARARLGYEPIVTLDEGLARTWAWCKANQPTLNATT
jgi:UDP-glucose 4-epimerase